MERRLRADVEALAGLVRGSASPGERASAEWVAGRLREEGAVDVELQSFRYQPTYAMAHAAHLGAGLLAARRAGALARAVALAVMASLELEASGRAQWLRRLLPGREGVNVVARVPAGGEPRATMVVLAHHDAARSGLAWHPRLLRLGAARARRRRRMEPRLGLAGVALVGAASPWRAVRRAATAVLVTGIAAELDIATSPTVPGANDNATGVAALLAVAGAVVAAPPEHVETLLVAPGCEESGMGGTAAFLRRRRFDPARTFVLGLDTLGSGTPIVATAEATLLPSRYRPRDLAMVDAGAARAGVDPPERWRLGAWTDPILARHAGLPAASLLSVDDDGLHANWHRMTDTPDRVDLGCVERCAAIAAGTVEAFADSVT